MKHLTLVAAVLLIAAASLGAQTERHTMRHQGQEREYWLYVPDSLCARRPLVFICHGYGGKAEGYFKAMIDCARRHGFVLTPRASRTRARARPAGTSATLLKKAGKSTT